MDQLRRELAAARESARLEADLVADRKALSEMPEALSVADPQSATIKQLTGAEEQAVRSAIAILISVLVEFGSAFGFTLSFLAFARPLRLTAKADITHRQPGKVVGVRPIKHRDSILPIVQTPDDLVTTWTLDRLDIVSSGALQADEAFRDFHAWCLHHNHEPLTPQMFGRRFTKVHADLGGRKVRRRGRAYYLGTALPDCAKPKRVDQVASSAIGW